MFGLSATGDLERCTGNFNTAWLKRQGANLIELTQADKAVITDLNRTKAKARGNQIFVEQAAVKLSDDDEFSRLRDYVDALAVTEDFGATTEHPKERVYSFFATLEHLLTREHSVGEAHLLFYNSYRQIEHVLAQGDESEPPFFVAERENVPGRDVFHAYRLTYHGKTFSVIFYNAEKARNLEQYKDVREAYEALFWEDYPVLLVTTYPSAGNGINLQFRPSKDAKDDKLQDFSSVHLLDSPYFYFGKVERDLSAEDERQTIKKNIWYLAKLTEAKSQTEERFKQFLGNIRTQDLNSFYKTTNDALLNRVASYIQALGRAERTWSKTPDQTVRLHPDVYRDFERFCTDEDFQYIVGERWALFSSNTQRIFEHIRRMKPEYFKKAYFGVDEGLRAQDQRCRDAVARLLGRIDALRRGAPDAEVRREWQALRRAILQHEFQSNILKEYHCVYHYPYLENGSLYLDAQYALYPPGRSNSDLRKWQLGSAYTKVADNQTLRRHFELRGYELGFNDFGGNFFVPYCYQALLLGAIGEEAVAAVLGKEKLRLEELSDALFELADLKLSGAPWYIDCKNYSAVTLEDIALPADDPSKRTPLNEQSFKENALRKRERLGSDAKLIYLNLFGDERPLRYFDGDFANEVRTLEQASFVVVQGVLSRTDPNTYTDAFHTFLRDARKLLEDTP